MTTNPLDRLVRKEVALATIRALEPPQGFIGLSLCPFKEVASDDVIWDYAKPEATGLAPARAEDAESELAQKDDIFGGTARASIIDWAQKDHYTASDVSRYREALLIEARLGGLNGLSLPQVGSQLEDMRAKFARGDASRRRRLDNRIEWLIMTALSTGGLTYNDNKIKFTVDYGRPAGQHDQAPADGLFTLTTSDPIGEILTVKEYMSETHGVDITRAVTSQKVVNSFMNSSRFIATTGLVVGGTPSSPIDMNYVLGSSWNPAAVLARVESATGVRFTIYDSVYRTRPIGSTTNTLNRFFPQNKILFLPDETQVAELEDGDGLGLGRTLTSPHPEGMWTAGFYEWEKEDRDPWGVDRGTGIKAFPVFPAMQYTFTMNVLA